jgi:hypothetical protein
MMNSVGNLTLLTQGLNSSISNGAFPGKVRDIADKSDLRLNAFLRAADAPSVWDEDDIRARAELLFGYAQKIWPRPISGNDGMPGALARNLASDGEGIRTVRGYAWRSGAVTLFLPEGTDIRMNYKGEFHYAKVDGDHVIYLGNRVSPHRMAALVTNSSRDAWRDLWIRRPDDDDWALADSFRPKVNLTLDDLDL